jgi:AcrR family transcriptional regulator
MDAVAAGAGTSKTVVYRRWKTRAELVLATMRAHASAPPIGAESGTLRGDVLAILQWLADRFHDYPDVVRGLMAELPDAEQPVTATSHDALEKAVRLAIERGEIVPAKVSERRISVPIDLLRHQMFVTRRAATREEIEEIVDGVFLPLVSDPRP